MPDDLCWLVNKFDNRCWWQLCPNLSEPLLGMPRSIPMLPYGTHSQLVADFMCLPHTPHTHRLVNQYADLMYINRPASLRIQVYIHDTFHASLTTQVLRHTSYVTRYRWWCHDRWGLRWHGGVFDDAIRQRYEGFWSREIIQRRREWVWNPVYSAVLAGSVCASHNRYHRKLSAPRCVRAMETDVLGPWYGDGRFGVCRLSVQMSRDYAYKSYTLTLHVESDVCNQKRYIIVSHAGMMSGGEICLHTVT